MNQQEIVQKVANELDIPPEVIKEAYLSSWKFIKSTIQELPLKDALTEDQFRKLRTNFNLPSLGKLYVTYEDFRRIKDKYEHYKKIKKYEQDS